MCAASDRIGVLIHESFADNPPEWVEWDLTGKLLSRTTLKDRWSAAGRAFTSDGRLYAQSQWAENGGFVLDVLDTATSKWTAVPDNLPEEIKTRGAFLLAADGEDLVYKACPGGNVRLLWVRPGVR